MPPSPLRSPSDTAIARDTLVLVDERDREIGTADKQAAHERGLLHRAFSVFLVADDGRLLMQRRNPAKYHSGGLWANACCGHPRPGERTLAGARRRLFEELGVAADLSLRFVARYSCALKDAMFENEIVHVYSGRLTGHPAPHPMEIAEVAFMSVADVQERIRSAPEDFAVWLRHYFDAHGADIEGIAAHP